MKIEGTLAKFLVQLEADGRSSHTIRLYSRHIRLFASWAHEVPLCGDVSKISHEDIARFLTSPVARTRPDGRIKKATSQNALRTSLKCFFSYLHRTGHISRYSGRLIRLSICGTPPPKALSEEEINRFLDCLLQGKGFEAERDHALFHLMLATGIRLGSAMDLDIKDVDYARGEIWIKSTKGDCPERFFLGKTIKGHLVRFISNRTMCPLFTGRSGGRLSHRHVQRCFSMWFVKSGITRTASVHYLRHTFATRLY